MSTKEKLLKRFFSKPKDLTWDEYVKVFKIYGFNLSNGNGSKRRFYNNDKLIFTIHEPHPGNIMKHYTIVQAIDFFNENDIT